MAILDNPVLIDILKLSETLEKKPVVNLYSNPLDFPVLQLFESQFGMLFDVGIDPNALVVGKDIYTRFYAAWEGVVDAAGKPKLNQKGNQYKNITALLNGREAAEGSANAELLAVIRKMAVSLEEIKALVGGLSMDANQAAGHAAAALVNAASLPPNPATVQRPNTARANAQTRSSQPALADKPETAVPSAAAVPSPAEPQQAAERQTAVSAVTSAEWVQRAGQATDKFDFDLCIQRGVAFYTDIDRAENTRQAMFGDWKAGEAAAYAAGMTKYASVRVDLEATKMVAAEAHKKAKSAALVAYRSVLESPAKSSG